MSVSGEELANENAIALPAGAPGELTERHPLQSRWALWYLKGDRNRDWEDCLKQVSLFDTVEDFWALYNHIQLASGLNWGSDYYLFKEGIKPMWEDENNVKGGRWLVVIDKQKRADRLDRYWMELLMAMIGEQFEEHGEHICGAVINVRQKGDKVSLWTRDALKDDVNLRIGQILKAKLEIPDNEPIRMFVSIRELYVAVLIRLFEWVARQIHATSQEKKQNAQLQLNDYDESEHEDDEYQKMESEHRNESDADEGYASDARLTFALSAPQASTDIRGTSIIRREASMDFNEVHTDAPETAVNIRGWEVIKDSTDFMKAGLEAIIEDEVTCRFEAEQLTSWNMLTRNSIGFYRFVNWKLTALWALGCLFRYSCLLPLRLCIFGVGLIFLVGSTAMIGLIAEGELKRSLNRRCTLICHRILCRALSAVVRFHDQHNKASEGGICVANHTSPLDVTILSTDNVYALIGQRQPGLLGLMQRALSRASAHIFFERSDMRDRAQVSATMREHVNDPNKLPILIFPEGTCINNTSVMMFKKGSFELGTKIYPVAMKYDSRFGDAFWNSSEQGWFEYLIGMMTSWAIICDVWYLPPMEKQDGEDAVDFASRVKKTIAKRGGLVDLEWDGCLKRTKIPKKFVVEQQNRYFHRIARYMSHSEDH